MDIRCHLGAAPRLLSIKTLKLYVPQCSLTVLDSVLAVIQLQERTIWHVTWASCCVSVNTSTEKDEMFCQTVEETRRGSFWQNTAIGGQLWPTSGFNLATAMLTGWGNHSDWKSLAAGTLSVTLLIRSLILNQLQYTRGLSLHRSEQIYTRPKEDTAYAVI